MYQKAWCTRKVVVLLIKPFALFLPLPLPSPSSLLKLPAGLAGKWCCFVAAEAEDNPLVASPPRKWPSHNNRASYVGFCRREISFHFQYTFTLALHSFIRLLFRVRFLCRVFFFLLFFEIENSRFAKRPHRRRARRNGCFRRLAAF